MIFRRYFKTDNLLTPESEHDIPQQLTAVYKSCIQARGCRELCYAVPGP